MLVFSCHADTGFDYHSLTHQGDTYLGHLDNFVGVYATMKAYFSGRINNQHTRIELTYGEETDMEGAREVVETLNENDLVIVVDVTATPTDKDIVIEKCKNKKLTQFMHCALDGLSYDLYADCPDPVSCFDEVDIYSQKCEYTCFLGIPTTGGDYNETQVNCTKKSVESIARAICRISEYYPGICK